MRARLGLVVAAASAAAPAAAQTVGVNNPSPYGPAPWVSGAPQSRGTGREGVGEVVVTGSRIAAPPPAPAAGEEPLQITLAPPLEELDETACVVYALAG